mmetsp:Transcript_36568/g.79681  ORF Transcript_36568/g.79681 Transcript_36568/m.79681 type:complete len:170 (-) Transcript_36568:187-696(-)
MSSFRKSLLGLVERYMAPGKFVGSDKFGNKFYSSIEKTHLGEVVEKRHVVAAGSRDPSDFDREHIAVEWSSWLMHRRTEPPSLSEVERLERQRADMARKVAELAAEDAKQRVRSRALKPSEAATPDMALLHSQVGDESGRAAKPAAHEQPDEEASGTGASFKPGVWQPK